MAFAPGMTQTQAMTSEWYVYGVETLNGYDAWALFEASAPSNINEFGFCP